jgi:hypothetical protein
MQTSNHRVESSSSATSREPLRLLLSEAAGRGVLDGAWWPQSRDLQAELADLVAHFPPKSGRIIHAAYSRPDWQPAQRRIKIPGGVVKVGCYPRDDTHKILLGMANRETLQLMVVPSDMPMKTAQRAMQAASASSNEASATAILQDVRAREAAEHERARTATRWDDDGGEWWEPRSVLHSRRSRR